MSNLLGTTSDTVPRFVAKKWKEVHDRVMLKIETNQANK